MTNVKNKKMTRTEMLPKEFQDIRILKTGKEQLIPNFKKSISEFAELFRTMPKSYFESIELLTFSGHKIEVSNKYMQGRYKSAIVYLLQGNLSGKEICPNRTQSCSDGCLGTHSGQAEIVKHGNITNGVQLARLAKTIMLELHKDLFLEKLYKELTKLNGKAIAENVGLGFRFNGTSDLNFHKFVIPSLGVNFMEHFSGVKFYDYTKNAFKATQYAKGLLPKNYDVVYSYTPENHDTAESMLKLGVNVATAFATKKQVDLDNKTFLGAELVSGDAHDLRFVEYNEENKKGVIISLTAKGYGFKKDTSGFFVRPSLLEENTLTKVS
jgi:hypothetical protein